MKTKSNHATRNFLVFSLMLLLVVACQTEDMNIDLSTKTQANTRTVDVKDSYSKEELADICISANDDFITSLPFNYDEVFSKTFTYQEQEELILKRIEKESGEEVRLFAEKLHEDFKRATGKYYREAENKEVLSFLEKNTSFNHLLNNRQPLTCTYEEDGCIDMNSCDGIPSYLHFKYKERRHCPIYKVIDSNCMSKAGDCTYSYYWSNDFPWLNHFNGYEYEYYWYTGRWTYRYYVNGDLDGFRESNPNLKRFGTFLGNNHHLAVNLAWGSAACKYDEYVKVTRFGYGYSDEECAIEAPGNDRPR